MTARHETANLVMRRLARHDGYNLENMMAAERLGYNELANEIMAMIERKMAAQSRELADALATYWELPA